MVFYVGSAFGKSKGESLMDGQGIGDAIISGIVMLVIVALIVGAVLALGGLWIFHHVHISFGLK